MLKRIIKFKSQGLPIAAIKLGRTIKKNAFADDFSDGIYYFQSTLKNMNSLKREFKSTQGRVVKVLNILLRIFPQTGSQFFGTPETSVLFVHW